MNSPTAISSSKSAVEDEQVKRKIFTSVCPI